MTATRWWTRGLCALLALVLLIGSLLAIAEIVVAATGHAPWLVPYADWSAWLRGRAWSDSIMRAILLGTVLVGLLFLFLAVRRGKPRELPLDARTPGVDVAVSRRSIERSLAAAALRTKGIAQAEASVRRRTARIHARSVARSASGLYEDVESTVRARVDSLGLRRDLRLRVRITARGRR